MWQSEVDPCLPPLLSTVFFEIRSLNEHGAHRFLSLTRCPKNSMDPLACFPGTPPYMAFYVGSEDLNSSPYVFVAAL